MSVLVEQLESGNQADPSYLYIAKVLGSIPFRSSGEYEIETAIGAWKVETLSVVTVSMATRLNTDVPIATLPSGVLASSKNTVGSSLAAWKTISLVLLAAISGGMARVIV